MSDGRNSMYLVKDDFIAAEILAAVLVQCGIGVVPISVSDRVVVAGLQSLIFDCCDSCPSRFKVVVSIDRSKRFFREHGKSFDQAVSYLRDIGVAFGFTIFYELIELEGDMWEHIFFYSAGSLVAFLMVIFFGWDGSPDL